MLRMLSLSRKCVISTLMLNVPFFYLSLASQCKRIKLSSSLMNAELAKKAAEKVGNPNVLINLISRRVRQLNSGNGGLEPSAH